MASVPIIPDSYNHVLAEFECLDPLLSALRLDSSRLKCTCIDVSKRWLALGSSGGGLNLIQKDGWKQRLFLTHKVRVKNSIQKFPGKMGLGKSHCFKLFFIKSQQAFSACCIV
uniref:Uncharacterized protein n=1 Tax=Strix occidentalis caurina TaxID=311401 RepID=A0A8D0KS16_STROC